MKQFVLPEDFSSEQKTLRLKGKNFHYLIRVRRYNTGDRIPGICKDGKAYTLEFSTIGGDFCDVKLLADETLTTEVGNSDLGVRIVLVPAITKGKKMDLTVRQAVEAGASAVLPIITDHCQVRYKCDEDAETKQKRWERIAIEAIQQCGGKTTTEICRPDTLRNVVESWKDRGPILFLHEKALNEKNITSVSSGLFRSLAEAKGELAIIVGPEGGLSPDETQFLQDRGATPVFFGNRVLRAETAALYGLAVVSTIIRERSEWHPA